MKMEGIRASLILAFILNVVFFPALWGDKTLLLSARDASSIIKAGAYFQEPLLIGIGRTVDAGAPAWQSEPWLKIVCEQYGEHNLPLWNPYSAYGTPLAAAMQAQPFYPLTFLFCLHGTAQTFDVLIVGRLLVAGLLMFFYARLFLEYRPSLFAAISFMLSGYFTLYMNMPHLSVEVLLPGLFLTLELLLRTKSWLALVGLAGMIVLIAVGGMPESMFLIISFGCLYVLFRIAGSADLRPRGFARLGMAFAALVFGFALSAFVLLPFLEFMRLAHDTHQVANLGGHSRGLDYFDDGRAAITYLLPLIFGPVGNSIFAGGGWTGMTGYWGITACIFAVIAVLHGFLPATSSHLKSLRSLTIFFVTFLVLMFLKRFGHPVINWIGGLPLAELIVYPKYLEPLMAFCVAMLAGIGFSMFLESRTRVRYFIPLIAAMAVFCVMMALAGWSLSRMADVKVHAFVYYLSVLAGILVVLAATVLLLSGHRFKWTAWALLGLLSAELTCNFIVPCFYMFGSLPSAKMDPYAGAPYVDFLRARNDSHDRVFAREELLYPNWAGVFGLADVRNLDGMFYKRYMSFIRNFLLKPGDEGRQSGDLADRFTGAQAGYAYAFDTATEQRYLTLSSVRYLISGSEYNAPIQVLDEIVAQHRGENIWGMGLSSSFVGREGKPVVGLLQHPPSKPLSYKTVIDPRQPMFQGVVAMQAPAQDRSDGVGFLLEIRSSGQTNTLFSTVLNPKDILADRTGQPFEVDLTPYAGKEVDLLFSTDPGPSGNNAYDWGGWTRLRFVSQSEAKDATSEFKKVYEDGVSIYENTKILPRASLFGAAEVQPDDRVLARLKDPSFDPYEKVVLSAESVSAEDIAMLRPLTEAAAAPVTRARIALYESQRVMIEADSSTPAVLMLNDTNFPGWRATVNGKPTPILQADYLFRGVLIPAGKNIVEFSYQPTSFRLGAMISALALLALIAVPVFTYRRRQLSERRPITMAFDKAP
jgi:hypothetical protein